MTTNKPDIQAFLMKQDGHYEPYVSIQRDSGCTGMVYPLVRLCDYEALQEECERLRKDAERYRWLVERGDDFQWENIIRLDIEDFPSRCAAINAAMQEENK